MADDEQSASGMVSSLVQDFIAQLRAVTEGLEDLAGFGEHRLRIPGAFPLPGALSAAQLTSIASSVAAQRRSIEALKAQLTSFEEQLAVLEQILDPLAEWSRTWADLEERLLNVRRGQAENPGSGSLPAQLRCSVGCPDVTGVVGSDLDIVQRLAVRLQRSTRWGRSVGAVDLAQGFAAALREELDLRIEAQNMTAVAAAARDDDLRVPAPYQPYCGALQDGRLTVSVRLLADPADRRYLTGLVHRVLLAFLAAAAGIMAVLMIGLHGGPALSKTVSLYSFLGYCLLVIAAILAVRVLVQVLRPDPG